MAASRGPRIRRQASTGWAIALSLLCALGWPARASGQSAGAPASGDANAQTAAERITSLLSLIDADEAWYKELSKQKRRLDTDYGRASKGFVELDRRLSAALIERDTGAPEAISDADLATLEAERRAARDRFDALIQRGKALEKQLVTLKAKLSLERELLDDLRSGRQLSPATPSKSRASSERSPTAKKRGREPAVTPSDPVPDRTAAQTIDEGSRGLSFDPRVATAFDQLDRAKTDLLEAQRIVELIDRAISVFSADLESARALRDSARSEVEAVERERADVAARLEATNASEASPENLPDPAQQPREIQWVEGRLESARTRLTQHEQRIMASEQMVVAIDEARVKAIKSAAEAKDAVTSAEGRVAFVQSPLAPHRLLRWVTRSGPGILLIILVMLVLRQVAGFVSRRVVVGLVRRGRRGTQAARDERAETLSRVFRSTAMVVILLAGTLAILREAGLDITVLLGGAAVFGAAIAFGSQSLISDYFSGLMVLMENQYSVGNVVKIGSKSGIVEDITLRVTVLRDLEGVVHFIPHSQVTTVSNLTFGWSRVLLDIGVAYKENVDRVIEVLMTLAQEMKTDPVYSRLILEDPEMLGVEAFADSAVVIRFLVKTRPLEQWRIRRELLRRIKLRFDELGIEIPFPHRTVFHRGLGAEDLSKLEP